MSSGTVRSMGGSTTRPSPEIPISDVSWSSISAAARSADPEDRARAVRQAYQFVADTLGAQRDIPEPPRFFLKSLVSRLRGRKVSVKMSLIRLAVYLRNAVVHDNYLPEPNIGWLCVSVWAEVWELLTGQDSGIPRAHTSTGDAGCADEDLAEPGEPLPLIGWQELVDDAAWAALLRRHAVSPDALRRSPEFLRLHDEWRALVPHLNSSGDVDNGKGWQNRVHSRLGDWLTTLRNSLRNLPSTQAEFIEWAAAREFWSALCQGDVKRPIDQMFRHADAIDTYKGRVISISWLMAVANVLIAVAIISISDVRSMEKYSTGWILVAAPALLGFATAAFLFAWGVGLSLRKPSREEVLADPARYDCTGAAGSANTQGPS